MCRYKGVQERVVQDIEEVRERENEGVVETAERTGKREEDRIIEIRSNKSIFILY